LIKGTQESALVNAVIVFIKVAIVLIFIFIGWKFIKPENHIPYLIPEGTPGHDGFFKHGWGGVLGGSAIVFFAFIGFDAVSTAAQEAKNPSRDMPIGILGSLVVCTILYILFGHVLTGVAPYTDFTDATKGREASVAYAISQYMTGYGWLASLVTVAILAGFSSVILVMLMGQSRVFFTMSKDGLLPKTFSEVHPKFNTPAKATIWLFVLVGFFAAFVPGDIVGDMCSIGTLFAFVLVSLGVIAMRKSNPDAVRPFKVPLVPIIPLLGVLVCGFMIFGLGFENWSRLLIWLLVGFIIYILYSLKNSQLADKLTEVRKSKFVSIIGIVTAITLLILTYLVYHNPGHLIAANYETKAIDNYYKFIMIFSMANIVFYLINIVTKKEK
jgi:APA family basic amino acid/polyamine antiporter